MPTVKKYQNKSGYYINARVNNSVVTYQTTEKADRVFKKLDYKHGENISWKMIQQMKSKGDIYTGGSGVDTDDVAEDGDIKLSDRREEIYQRYLRGELTESSGVRVTDTGESIKIQKLPDEVKKKFLYKKLDDDVATLVSDSIDIPLIDEITIKESEITYCSSVEEGVKHTCRDKRLTDDPEDFEGEVEYSTGEGVSAKYKVSDGYLSEWLMQDGSKSEYSDVEKSHAQAFKSDFGGRRSLGFDVTNWTEVVRKFFLYMRYYDIRPYRSGHKGLCKAEELQGKHIWVNAHTTNKSSGEGTAFITRDELIKSIRIKGVRVDEPDYFLVEVGEINSGGKANAKPVPPRSDVGNGQRKDNRWHDTNREVTDGEAVEVTVKRISNSGNAIAEYQGRDVHVNNGKLGETYKVVLNKKNGYFVGLPIEE